MTTAAVAAQGLVLPPDDYLDLREPTWGAAYEQIVDSVAYTGPRGQLPAVISVCHPVLIDLIQIRRGWWATLTDSAPQGYTAPGPRPARVGADLDQPV